MSDFLAKLAETVTCFCCEAQLYCKLSHIDPMQWATF